MRVGHVLLDLARAQGRRSTFVVGTGKNVGKTVAVRAVIEAAAKRGLAMGVTSTGRDGEAVDAADAQSKPRIFLSPPTTFATARTLLPSHPASEILDVTPWETAAGRVVFARVRQAAHYELAGPAHASAIRQCVERFIAFGSDHVIVDGALDRVAALAGGDDSIIVAAGAAAAATLDGAVEDLRALCARLRIRAYDPSKAALHLDGALTPPLAAELSSANERRQIVVRDATRIVAAGKALLGILDALDVRCERPLNVVAVTIASIAGERYFEPRAFARAASRASGLPVFDVYASTVVDAA